MARKPDPNDILRPYRAWSVTGASPLGASMVYDRQRWVVWAWSPKTRVLTLVNPSGSVDLHDPYCMQWA